MMHGPVNVSLYYNLCSFECPSIDSECRKVIRPTLKDVYGHQLCICWSANGGPYKVHM